MAFPIIMPRQGQSVESCIIAKWFKKKGDPVAVGDLLFSYETDKAAFDEESKYAGTLLEIFSNEGDDVPVLTNVCVIGNPGEDISAFLPANPAASSPAAAPTVTEFIQTAASTDSGFSSAISPRAKNLAERTGVDYRHAAGSGPYGRVIERDIEELKSQGVLVTSAAKDSIGDRKIEGTGLGGRSTTADAASGKSVTASAPAPAGSPASSAGGTDYEEVKITNIRKVIGKAMFASISTTCQLTLNTTFDATEIMAFRKKVKENRESLALENITLNDIVVYAVSRTLGSHRDLNAHFRDDAMLYFRNAHIGIATDTERGLMVPTLFNANLKSLNEISAEIKSLVKECQKGTINPDLLKGGSFTITNLGSLDIESFTPVLNPPQTGILGVNNIVQRARETADGEYEFYPAMGLSLTFDHRAVDGAPAAKFLKELRANLENFSLLLTK
jgi:pyruvate dehydrogenase E2 component (dihydrolipoamide acetyltransferase)